MSTLKPIVPIKILDRDFFDEFGYPKYHTEAAAAIDLRARVRDSVYLAPGESELIPTGISIYTGGISIYAGGATTEPSVELCALIIPRSGMGHNRGLVLGNLVGLIDPDYQGELMVSMWNRSLREPQKIHRGDRIAQLMFMPSTRVELFPVEHYANETSRGSGGFGHTGN